MIGLAPVTLVAAVIAVLVSGFLTASPELIARSLAALAAALFAGGYGLVMWGHLRAPEHALVIALTRTAVGAVSAAALITAWQLLFVNDTVAAGVSVTLWLLVVTGAAGTALVPLARRFTST